MAHGGGTQLPISRRAALSVMKPAGKEVFNVEKKCDLPVWADTCTYSHEHACGVGCASVGSASAALFSSSSASSSYQQTSC